jgi:hypothetical protein
VLQQVGPFEHVSFGTDWLMWLRIAAAGYEVGYLPDVLTEYGPWYGDWGAFAMRPVRFLTHTVTGDLEPGGVCSQPRMLASTGIGKAPDDASFRRPVSDLPPSDRAG